MNLRKKIKRISVLSICLLSACASGSETLESETQTTASESVAAKQTFPKQDSAKIGKEAINMDDAKPDNYPIKMWQVKPGSPVYNQEGKAIRSLRLQSSLMVHDIEGDRAIINKESGDWVNVSDLTPENPQILLEAPIDSNGLPRISLEEMMKMKPKGDGN